MFCTNCGSKNDDQAQFCANCGTRFTPAAPVNAAPPPQYAPPPQQYAPPPQQYAQQPQYAPPPQQYAAPQPPPKKKKKHGCLIVFLIFLVLVGALIAWILGAFDFLGGLGYSQKDYDSAMDKIGITIDFEGKNATEYKAWLVAHKGQKLPIDAFDIAFSDYEERSFSLTEAEANAFVNGVAPNLSWFDSIKFTINDDGSVSGKYKVDFKKVKDELIPDMLGQIPDAVSRFLPNTFTMSTRGTASILENQVYVPEPLTEFKIGPIPLGPVIQGVNGGPLDDATRQEIFDVTARIYTQIPDLLIHFLGVEDGEFKFEGYMPTLVTVSEK
jgi:hypothetical protein